MTQQPLSISTLPSKNHAGAKLGLMITCGFVAIISYYLQHHHDDDDDDDDDDDYIPLERASSLQQEADC